MRFPWLSFPETQIHNDRWLLRFQIPLAEWCEKKPFDTSQSQNVVFKLLLRFVDEA